MEARFLQERLRSEGVPVITVYLFGSLATGKPHRWSDIDIAVVYKPFSKSRAEERKKIRLLREHFDVPIDIVCFRSEDLESNISTIAREVKRTGIPV